ncbi:MAG TPA: acyl-CoA desaturase [Pseudonocardiaceae bacterium]|jgi:fatty acid desaturase|nr:acyl-CoA desaturase [Pseudonocardiaceae bacterium]
MPAQTPQLSAEQIEAFGAEMDALRQRIVADLGAADTAYIRQVIRVQRGLEVAGRALLFAGFLPPAWCGGVVTLALAKIIDNMEIGHNVLHGQYDWMRDDALNSRDFDWDMVSPPELWRRSHNFRHHTYTNIVGKDRDIGYGILRVTPEQRWHPYYLGNPVYAAVLSLVFQWGIMLHDLEIEKVGSGEKSWAQLRADVTLMAGKALRQVGKDYVLFPVLSGPLAPLTFAGNAAANLIRNVWAFSIIFCGHFPAEVATFTEEETAGESRGRWYLRQLLGSANITGSKLFHLLSGNLSHQIEHHLFPDLPARRYAQIAAEVRDACRRYGLPYHTGPLRRQLGSVFRQLARLAWPGPTPVAERRSTSQERVAQRVVAAA